jgi:hypothetical protein
VRRSYISLRWGYISAKHQQKLNNRDFILILSEYTSYLHKFSGRSTFIAVKNPTSTERGSVPNGDDLIYWFPLLEQSSYISGWPLRQEKNKFGWQPAGNARKSTALRRVDICTSNIELDELTAEFGGIHRDCDPKQKKLSFGAIFRDTYVRNNNVHFVPVDVSNVKRA